MSSDFRQAVSWLLNQLEVISHQHRELTDTDVREALHRTINYYFVWGHAPSQVPVRYGMFTREGDQQVSDVVRQFVREASRCADDAGLMLGHPRLDALQDSTIRTEGGMLYDELVGHRDTPLGPEPLPALWFEPTEEDMNGEP